MGSQFEKKNGIVSRKVTKTVTKKKEETLKSTVISKFRSETIEEIHHYDPRDVSNTDQIGINQEIRRLRTLTQKGERDTILIVHIQLRPCLPLVLMAGLSEKYSCV